MAAWTVDTKAVERAATTAVARAVNSVALSVAMMAASSVVPLDNYLGRKVAMKAVERAAMTVAA